MYYDHAYEIKKREENNGIDNLIQSFLNKLLIYYVNNKHDEIERILIGKNPVAEERIFRYSEMSPNSARYFDENSVVDVRVWINSETKRLLDTLYYVCKNKDAIVSLNNRIIELWLFETNTEMSKFFNIAKNIKTKREIRIGIEVENQKWQEIIKKSKLMSISVNEGFVLAANFYVEQKAKIHM